MTEIYIAAYLMIGAATALDILCANTDHIGDTAVTSLLLLVAITLWPVLWTYLIIRRLRRRAS